MHEPRSIKSIFGDALAQRTIDRSAFVAQACDGDEAKRDTVERLLKAHRRQRHFMERAPRLPDIGPCQVLLELGRGPYGTVCLASRNDDQAKRLVAILVMNPGSGNPESLRGFEEGQASRMERGSLEDGRAYWIWNPSEEVIAYGLNRLGALLFRLGDLKDALSPLLMSVELLEHRAAEQLGNSKGDERRAAGLRDLGDIYSTLADREASPPKALELWRLARDCYQRSLEVFLESAGGEELPKQAEVENQLGAEIARCEAALESLECSIVSQVQSNLEPPLTQPGARAASAGDSSSR